MRTQLTQLKRPPGAPFSLNTIARENGLKLSWVRAAAAGFRPIGRLSGSPIFSEADAKQIVKAAGRPVKLPPALGATPGETATNTGKRIEGERATTRPENSRTVAMPPARQE
ncbi:MAG: hypothetical protein ABSH08_13945 [Tepidisphaeraceae bacterium]|jgi:hypothetical protein